jgi:LemA protein
MSWLIALAILAPLLYGIVIYNRLVDYRNTAHAAWSDIDVQLKRRHDLIPKLIDAVRQYAAYEQSTLTAVTELRSRSEQLQDPQEKAPLETALGTELHRLIAVAEAYPELQADKNFLSLQNDISTVERDIQHARRFYNGAIRMLNTQIDTFPDLLIARFFRFQHGHYFQLNED